MSIPLAAQNLPSPASTLPAQTKSEADRLVDQLVENAATLHATLPSLTAHETIETHASRGIFWENSKVEATLQVLRGTSGGFLKQSRQFTAVNGKPIAPGKDPNASVLALSDALVYAQDMFFREQNRPCFVFAFAPQPTREGPIELRITANPEASKSNCAAGLQDLTGVVRVDPLTHQLIHVERTIPAEAAAAHGRVPFASTDYAPVRIGDKTFWLPAVTTASDLFGKVKMHSVAHYSDYHQYTANVTIIPGVAEPDAPQAPPQ